MPEREPQRFGFGWWAAGVFAAYSAVTYLVDLLQSCH